MSGFSWKSSGTGACRNPSSLDSGTGGFPHWIPGRTTTLGANVGGGFGAINRPGVPGGQGQDFTLNWFATAGVRHYLKPGFALSAGVMFQYWSNVGATDPNPSLDAPGPVLGATWSF